MPSYEKSGQGRGSRLDPHHGPTSSSRASSSRGAVHDGSRLKQRPPPLYAGNQSRSDPSTARSHAPAPNLAKRTLPLPPASCRQPQRSYADSLRGPAPMLVRRSGSRTFRVTFARDADSRHSRGAFRPPRAAGASALSPSLSRVDPGPQQRLNGVGSKDGAGAPLTMAHPAAVGPKRPVQARGAVSAPKKNQNHDQRSLSPLSSPPCPL